MSENWSQYIQGEGCSEMSSRSWINDEISLNFDTPEDNSKDCIEPESARKEIIGRLKKIKKEVSHSNYNDVIGIFNYALQETLPMMFKIDELNKEFGTKSIVEVANAICYKLF